MFFEEEVRGMFAALTAPLGETFFGKVSLRGLVSVFDFQNQQGYN